MAKKLFGTLIKNRTYFLGNKLFAVGERVEVTPEEARVLKAETRKFHDPTTQESHEIAIFKIEEEVEEETVVQEAAQDDAPQAPDAPAAPPSGRVRSGESS